MKVKSVWSLEQDICMHNSEPIYKINLEVGDLMSEYLQSLKWTFFLSFKFVKFYNNQMFVMGTVQGHIIEQ